MTALKPEELENRARHIFDGMIPDLIGRCRKFSVDSSEVDEEMMSLFKGHISELVSSILLAARSRSESDIRRNAHSLLGMGGTIGVPTLSVVAEQLSAGAKQGDYGGCLGLAEGLHDWESEWSRHGGANHDDDADR